MSSIYPSSYEMLQLFPAENIKVSFHQHPLRLRDAHQVPFHCAGCKENTLGKFYLCEDAENCDFHLHQRCYELSEMAVPPSIAFSFLKSKKCSFEFQKGAPGGGGERACDACGNGVKGWFFKCERCKKPHYLHPSCTSLPIKQKGENGIVLRLQAKTSSKCQRCESEYISEGIRGWFYVSNCRAHCYHVGCVKGMISENLNEGGEHNDRQDHLIIEESTVDRKSSCGSTSDLTRVHAIINRSGNGRRKKILVKAALVALNIIISAIIGVPISGACAAFFKLF